MSRSGYSDDCDGWSLIRWRGAVNAAINGKRGQAFLREMLATLDAMPEKRLIADDLVDEGGSVCAIGSVGVARGVNMDAIDPHDRDQVAQAFGIAPAMAAEIEFINDRDYCWAPETPEQRFARVRAWAAKQLAPPDRKNYACDEWHQKAVAKWQAKQGNRS